MKRTHFCGDLRRSDIDTSVTLCGWAKVIRDQSHQLFIDLRDRSGVVQCVIDRDTQPGIHNALSGVVKTEACLQLSGVVRQRLAGKENPRLKSGEIEVQVLAGEILNNSKTLPFELDEDTRTEENARLQYRYLDLRRETMRDNLQLRYRAGKLVRDFLDSEGFWEIETPLLWKSTPEGAREFIVPRPRIPGKPLCCRKARRFASNF